MQAGQTRAPARLNILACLDTYQTTLQTPEPPHPLLPLINMREQRVTRQRRRVAADREQEPREVGRPLRDERRREFALEARATDACRGVCLLYTSPSPRDATLSRMPSSA